MAFRKINLDFSALSTNAHGINWNDSIGKVVTYDISGTTYRGLIMIHDVFDGKIKIQIDDNNPIIITVQCFRAGNIAKQFGAKAKYYKYTIGDIINGVKILEQILIEKFVSVDGQKVKSSENGYHVKCLNDGYEFNVLEKYLSKSKHCPICGHIKVVRGINDIATTDPNFAKWIVNDSDKYSYSRDTNKSILLKCPTCGKEFYGIPNRYKTEPSCICNDNVSYSEKIMSSVLSQLNVPYIYQLNSSNFSWCQKYKYDFYFEYNYQKYIIEMDGAFHYVYNYKNNTSVSESQKIDRKKDEIANANGCHMIRINSNYRNVKSRLSYIKNNILNSELKLIFDLSNINWNRCEQYASTSLIKTINDLWNDGLSKSEIRQKIKLGKTTIDSYLEIGKRLGLSDYRPGIRHYISDDNKKYLKVQDKDNNILCVHLGISDFSRESTKLIGHKIGISQIYRYLKGSINNRKGLKFSYASKEEYIGFITNVS